MFLISKPSNLVNALQHKSSRSIGEPLQDWNYPVAQILISREAGWTQSDHHHEAPSTSRHPEEAMHSVIYLIGLIVVIMAILSFLGLR